VKYAFAWRSSYLASNGLKVLLTITQLLNNWLFIAKYPLKPKSDNEKIKLILTTVPAQKMQKPECKLFGSHSGFY
jgi:hypothetical protein